MHKRLVFVTISRILWIVSLCMAAPLAWAMKDRVDSRESVAFLLTMFAGFLVALTTRIVFRFRKEEYLKLNAKDGLAIVGLSWIALSLFGALPFFLSGAVHGFTNAFFEVVSGFTTTGATVFTDIEALPRGILFWRSLTHWLGGMGIIVLYLALLPALGQTSFQLFNAESPGITAERIQPRIKETAKVLWAVYFLLSGVETMLLMAGGMPLFDSLCHTFGTMATGGFSTKNAGIGAYGAYIQWVIILFMFLAGTNFVLHYQALKGDIKGYFRSEEFRFYTGLTVSVTFLTALALTGARVTASPVRDAAFQVVSILTTTGYATRDFNLWPVFLQFTLVLLMFIGGCGGSTGGGLKVVRVLVALKMAWQSVIQALFPNAVLPVKMDTKPLAPRLALGVLAYFVIFILLFFFGILALSLTERCDLVTSFSASVACLSNIGPGLARVGAVQNYAWISAPGKWVLIFLMLAGRLELYSILILALPAAWKK